MSEPAKPMPCPQCHDLIEESRLELVLCGGLHVGHTGEPRRWLLRSIDETDRVKQRTRDLQQSANLSRKLAFCEQDRDSLKTLVAQIMANAGRERDAITTTSNSVIAGLERQIADLKLELKMKENA